MTLRYGMIISLQGDDYDEFEAALHPDRESYVLGWPHLDAGLDYLQQWDYGETTDEEYLVETTYALASPGERHYERGEYVMVWHVGLSMARLYRRLPDEED